ncbi:MAG: L-seryl-tRNA(Sec) selenium transferase, partial [Thermomicrobiales bacterium]|nr:L-seryl-tRNA(Sec) selenium transferase [Thermomicrobiales bacterium]
VLKALGPTEVELKLLTQLVREELDQARGEIAQGRQLGREEIVDRARATVDGLLGTRFDPVINGTGVILHTNLGRAPVSAATSLAMSHAASGYLSLELDPETNRRGGRMDEISRLMRASTGAEATLAVNNNAAAVLLTLTALCSEKEIIVSRGEAVEIGGGFRIPDVVAQSGCTLVEVGTTNRTYSSDYVRALSDSTGALLKVHPSNFRVEGFTASPSTGELAAVASEHHTVLIEDLGSGALIDTSRFGLRHEPTVSEAIANGASVVTFSGDKLLGGPQAGLIVGRKELVGRIERHPLARAVRADKTTLAGLGATMRHYVAGEALHEIPVWRMIAVPSTEIWARAEQLARPMGLHVVDTMASIGGGTTPMEMLPSHAICISNVDAERLARRLRMGTPRIFPIIRDRDVLIDLRAVQPAQDDMLRDGLRNALS